MLQETIDVEPGIVIAGLEGLDPQLKEGLQSSIEGLLGLITSPNDKIKIDAIKLMLHLNESSKNKELQDRLLEANRRIDELEKLCK